MPLMLVRYGEIGLKSHSVRRRFERSLVENIENAFVAAKGQCRVTGERGRIYVGVEDAAAASVILKRVFGIVSFSEVAETGSELEGLKKFAAEYSMRVIGEGETFAVKATRQGSHPYTSLDMGKEIGQAILDAHAGRSVTVDLDSPDRKIFVEVRARRAFVFSDAVKGPGGLPMGSQGKVLAILEKPEDAVAAWLLMRRGCKAALLAEDDALAEPLAKWDPHLRVYKSLGDAPERVAGKLKCQAIVTGGDSERPASLSKGAEMPWLHPLVGLSRAEMSDALAKVREGAPPSFGSFAR
jgi:thiamine biosynthesis protein ThiI